jgi:sigma-B regulation protein RsbU (phosphoserine phosphatase)
VLLLYTDGVIEAANADLGQFGPERLCLSLQSAATLPAALILDQLLAELGAWTTRQRDDLTLVVLRYCPSASDRVTAAGVPGQARSGD